MVCPLPDVEALYAATKRLLKERRKMDRLSQAALAAPNGKRAQKLSPDLNWQAMHVDKIEAEVHARAVDCGFAEIRPREEYSRQTHRPSPFHTYISQPALPLAYQERPGQ
jgi:hypothetical protein